MKAYIPSYGLLQAGPRSENWRAVLEAHSLNYPKPVAELLLSQDDAVISPIQSAKQMLDHWREAGAPLSTQSVRHDHTTGQNEGLPNLNPEYHFS